MKDANLGNRRELHLRKLFSRVFYYHPFFLYLAMGGGVFMFLKVSWLWLSASLPIQTDLKESNSFGAVSDSAYHGRNIAPAAIGNQHYTDSAVYYEYRSIIGDTQWIPASSGLIQIGSEDKDRQQIELRVREGTKTPNLYG